VNCLHYYLGYKTYRPIDECVCEIILKTVEYMAKCQFFDTQQNNALLTGSCMGFWNLSRLTLRWNLSNLVSGTFWLISAKQVMSKRWTPWTSRRRNFARLKRAGLSNGHLLYYYTSVIRPVLHCVPKKTSPTFSTVTWKPMIRFW